MQAQYEQHQASSDQVSQTGSDLNQDRFLVRRGRLRFDAAWQWCELAFEIDGNTQSTPTVGPKRINASLVWRGHPWDGRLEPRSPRAYGVPLARFTLGLTGIPFGFELADSPKDRVFLERSTASRPSAFFPGEQDLGALLTGGVGFFRYSVAAMNGDPLGDSSSNPVGAPTHAKDIIARLGFDQRARGRVEALRDHGRRLGPLRRPEFHARSTDATKPTVQWTDQNQNGVIDPGEIVGVPGMAATPSQTFSHWGVTVDLGGRAASARRSAWGMLYGELTRRARNLDRGLFVADPITSGVDVREVGRPHRGNVQEVMRYGLVGFRFDYYDPNADFFDKTGGKLVPSSQAIKTFSPLIGAQIPDRARLLFQYDVVRNLLAPRARPAMPADQPRGPTSGRSACRCSCEAAMLVVASVAALAAPAMVVVSTLSACDERAPTGIREPIYVYGAQFIPRTRCPNPCRRRLRAGIGQGPAGDCSLHAVHRPPARQGGAEHDRRRDPGRERCRRALPVDAGTGYWVFLPGPTPPDERGPQPRSSSMTFDTGDDLPTGQQNLAFAALGATGDAGTQYLLPMCRIHRPGQLQRLLPLGPAPTPPCSRSRRTSRSTSTSSSRRPPVSWSTSSTPPPARAPTPVSVPASGCSTWTPTRTARPTA